MSRLTQSLIKIIFSIIFLCSIAQNSKVFSQENSIKLLVLIIASDTFDGLPVPIYPELEKAWRSYMHLDPEHIEAYFIKADPNLPTSFQIEGDVIWSKTTESARPGVLNKTLLSLECLSEKLNDFDYVLRTNLSSFFIFSELLKKLGTLPKTKCYFGPNTGQGSKYGSGCGFILSSDLARLLIKSKNRLYNRNEHDDVMIGEFLIKRGVNLILSPRVDFANAKEWDDYKSHIDSSIFHFRIKNPEDSLRFTEKVYKEDLYVHHEMIDLFYNK